MNLDQLRRKLIAVARAHPPASRVPYAFEKRVMARLQAPAPLDHLAWWAAALWRASAPCVGLMILLAAWSWFDGVGAGSYSDLSQEFENTVLVAADVDLPADSL